MPSPFTRSARRLPWQLAVLLACVLAPGRTPAGEAKSATEEQTRQAHNAARADRGGRIGLTLGPKAGKDARNAPEEVGDGNLRTRCVVWLPPYTFRIELVDRLPVTELSFICSEYAGEESPDDISIRLSDGTSISTKLAVLRPEKGKPKPRQTVPIGREVAWLEVEVLSHHPGLAPAEGKAATWGGIAEIEVITTADLDAIMVVPEFNAAAPAYVEGANPRNDYTGLATHLPAAIPLGQYPGVYATRDEIERLRAAMAIDPRAAEMLATLRKNCDEWVGQPVVLPDPKIPAQMKDRSDAQAKAHGLMSKKAGWLGWAYQVFGGEPYAAKAREILVGYAKLYPNDYVEHKGVHSGDTSKVMAQRLSEAMWLLPLIQSYDLVHDSAGMTEEDRKLIEEDLIRTALTFINSKRPAAAEIAAMERKDPAWRTTTPNEKKTIVGNWTNFYNAAFIQGGIVLRDQNWIDLGMAQTRLNLARGIGEDGMWGEGAIGYHLFGRHALIACLEPLARHGYDLYSFNSCAFKNLFDSPFAYAYPDGTAPGINDSGRVSIGGSWPAMAYDFAWLRYQDPNYGRIINDCGRQVFQSEGCYFPTMIYDKLPEQPMTGLNSLVFDSLGYAILRGTDSGGPTFMLMDYGPHGGGHGHPDKLNLILFADGDELAGEPAVYRYEDALHADWTRPSIAHWTVSIDQRSQMAATGKLLAFCDAGGIKAMRGICGTAYPGVGLDRTVIQMPGYIADVYRCWSKAKHTFDYPLRFPGVLDALRDVKPEALQPMASSVVRGYSQIQALPEAPIGGDWTGVWRRAAVTGKPAVDQTPAVRQVLPSEVKATVLSGPGTTAFMGVVPDGRHQAILRREGTSAIFATVIDPFREADAVRAVEEIQIAGPVPAYGLKVSRTDGGTDLIFVRFDPQVGGRPAAAATFAGGETDALIAVVRLDAAGTVIAGGMIGGMGLRFGERTLVRETPGNAWMK